MISYEEKDQLTEEQYEEYQQFLDEHIKEDLR